jgi:hypothetical protein
LPGKSAETFDPFGESDVTIVPESDAIASLVPQWTFAAGYSFVHRKKLRDAIATETFPTVIGPVKFEGGFNIQAPGEIGQWQNGEFEVVAGKKKRTAKPIFPKTPWP